jgi:hypothetical protein
MPSISAPDYSGRAAPILYGDTPAVLRYLTLFTGFTFLLIEGLLFFRLWTQLMASIPDSGLASGVYAFAGELAAPFRPFEGATPAPGGPHLEFFLLVAIEGYLLSGLFSVGLLYGARRIAQTYLPNPWLFDTQPVLDALIGADIALERSVRQTRATMRAFVDEAFPPDWVSRPLPVLSAWPRQALDQVISTHKSRQDGAR